MVSNLPPSPNIFTESKVALYYYSNSESKDLNFQLLEISSKKVLSILKSLNPSKAAGIDNLSGHFLKDSADVLAQQISQLAICLSNSTPFQELAKLLHLNENIRNF